MTTRSFRTGRPGDGEYPDYQSEDIEQVPGDHAPGALETSRNETLKLFARLDEAKIQDLRYSVGKWTPKEILGHLIDDERIFVYRALSVARGDRGPLPPFDENLFVETSGFEERSLHSLLDEYRAVRAATLALFESLPEAAWDRRGTVTDYETSVRGMAFHIAGHELHHLRVLRERYLPLIAETRRDLPPGSNQRGHL